MNFIRCSYDSLQNFLHSWILCPSLVQYLHFLGERFEGFPSVAGSPVAMTWQFPFFFSGGFSLNGGAVREADNGHPLARLLASVLRHLEQSSIVALELSAALNQFMQRGVGSCHTVSCRRGGLMRYC